MKYETDPLKMVEIDPSKDVYTYEEAVREVYRLNGWGEPKSIRKQY